MIPEEKQDRRLPVVVAEPIRVPYPPAEFRRAGLRRRNRRAHRPPLALSLDLRRHRWKILAFVAACVAATLIVSARLTPIYESTPTIDIDRRMPTGIIGQEASNPSTNDADQFLATQIKLIQSDSVLRPVAQKYKLRELEGEDWDKEPVKTGRRRRRPGHPEEAEGHAPAQHLHLLLIGYRSTDKRLAADVANAIARSYLEHTYNIRYRASAGLSQFMEKQLEELNAKMERSERSAGAVRARVERHQSGGEDQHPLGAPAAIEHGVHQRPGRPREEGSAYNSVRAARREAAQFPPRAKRSRSSPRA